MRMFLRLGKSDARLRSALPEVRYGIHRRVSWDLIRRRMLVRRRAWVGEAIARANMFASEGWWKDNVLDVYSSGAASS
jgi:hypothetical protein